MSNKTEAISETVVWLLASAKIELIKVSATVSFLHVVIL